MPATQTAQLTDAAAVALLSRASALLFAPGSAYRYSNTGYCLLALIVEHVSGRSFATYLRDQIFSPLGMAGTVAHEEGVSTLLHRAFGHTLGGGGTDSPPSVRRTDQSVTSATLGDGGVYASVADLAIWLTHLLTLASPHETHTPHKQWIISPQTFRTRFLTPFALSDGRLSPYSFGFFVDCIARSGRPTTRVFHHGETTGFTNALLGYPDLGLMLVLLTNRTAASNWKLEMHLADSRAGAEPWALLHRVADLYYL